MRACSASAPRRRLRSSAATSATPSAHGPTHRISPNRRSGSNVGEPGEPRHHQGEAAGDAREPRVAPRPRCEQPGAQARERDHQDPRRRVRDVEAQRRRQRVDRPDRRRQRERRGAAGPQRRRGQPVRQQPEPQRLVSPATSSTVPTTASRPGSERVRAPGAVGVVDEPALEPTLPRRGARVVDPWVESGSNLHPTTPGPRRTTMRTLRKNAGPRPGGTSCPPHVSPACTRCSPP